MRAPRLAAVLGAALAASPASALTINSTWNGTVGSWSDATRWSSNPLVPNNGGGDTFNVTMPGGTVTLDIPVTIDALTLSGSGTITGTQNLSTQGLFSWSAGTLSGTGTLFANGGLVLNTSAHPLSNKTLMNAGAATLTAGNGNVSLDGASALFDNLAGATFTAGASGGSPGITFSGTAGLFRNAGTFTKVGSNTLDVSAFFQNQGLFDVQAGLVTVSNSGFTNAGVLDVDGGAELRFTGGTGHSFAAGSTAGGSGTLRMTAGTLAVATDLGFSAVNLDGGTLSNAGAVNVNGLLRWNAGTVSGAGTLFANGGLVLNTSAHILSSKTLVNAGAATLTAGNGNVQLDGASALFDNLAGATFTAGASGGTPTISFSGTAGLFRNTGTFTKVGSNTLSVSVPMQNTGLVDVQGGSLTFSGAGALTQTAGALRLSGGSVTSATSLNLQGGALEGRGTVSANVTATGATILPGGDGAADDIILNGNLTLGAASVLDFDLGGLVQGVSYDYLDVNGTAPLAGTLRVSFIGGFESVVGAGDVFTLLTANAALAGAFANVASGNRLTAQGNLGSFLVSYGAGSPFGADRVVLSEFVPEPPTLVLLVAGLAGLHLAARRRR